MNAVPLIGDYSYRLLSWEELHPKFEEYKSRVFNRSLYFDAVGSLSETEQEFIRILGGNMGTPYRLCIGIFYRDEFVGWHLGKQEDSDKFFMRNTGIFPEHRNKGVYSALLPLILSMIEQKGFQVVCSRHHASNNAVIVPKLKAGFIISGFELSDKYGVLVHLSYYFNPLRRKAMLFRTGEVRPDDETRVLINL